MDIVVAAMRNGSIIAGVVLGVLLQSASLYTRIDGDAAVVGLVLLLVGIIFRSRNLKQLAPPPLSDEAALRKYKRTINNRKVLAKLDFAAWGSTMLAIEAFVIILFVATGHHFPVAP